MPNQPGFLVMGALVMTMLTGPEGALVVGMPELSGLILAAVVVARTRNVLAGLLAAMGIFWLLRYLIS